MKHIITNILTPTDKALHFWVGATLFAITGDWFILIAIACIKEVYDHYKPNGREEILDIVYTIAGGVLAWVCQLAWGLIVTLLN